LLGSFIHNFVDGLSTGLVFAIGDKHFIIATVVAIFSHEVPRELGDVAILLENRFNGCQAILSNGIINFMSLVGVVVGLSTVGVP
jgi:zinc and cadmium transporter